MARKISYTFFITGKKDSDAAVLKVVGDCPYILFELPYTAPYQEFHSIREFQYKSRYRPFRDENTRKKTAIIDLSQWIGHEGEEYLEIFTKFLHDLRSFFHYDYIFTVKDAAPDSIQELYGLIAQYLGEGKIVRACAAPKQEMIKEAAA